MDCRNSDHCYSRFCNRCYKKNY